MNTLPEEIQNTIYKFKHQMQFREVVKELNCMGICRCMHCYICCEFCDKIHPYFNCPLECEYSDDDSDHYHFEEFY